MPPLQNRWQDPKFGASQTKKPRSIVKLEWSYWNDEDGKHVGRALTLPMHLRMARLESRTYMEEYNIASNKIPALLELAKFDFDMIQSLIKEN